MGTARVIFDCVFCFPGGPSHGMVVGVGHHLAPATSFMAEGVDGVPLLRPGAVKSPASLPPELADPT